MKPERIVGISGMQKIHDNQFLVVHDTHAHKNPHLGVLEVRPHTEKPRIGYSWSEVELISWPDPEEQAKPNDLEGICALPGHDSDFLVSESGYYPKYGNFGRILRVHLAPTDAGWQAAYAGHFEPFPPPPDNQETPKHEQIEGIDCVSVGGEVILLIVRRGHKESPATLVWGRLEDLDRPNPAFRQIGSHPLTPEVVADRGAADLYLVEDGDGCWEVWSVASVDVEDWGPFRSSIYCAGTFEWTEGEAPTFRPHDPCRVLWDLEGLKVEALAPPAALVPESALSIATDDEDYWGVWRPILASRGAAKFEKHLITERVRDR